MRPLLASLLALSVLAGSALVSAQVAVSDLVDRASRYVAGYEGAFWILAMDEEYVQWLERPNNPGTNLSRNNPGGGMPVGGGQNQRRIVRSDFLLIQLGEGRGWLPVRDVFSINGRETRAQDDRLVRMFRAGREDAYDVAASIHKDSQQHDMGSVARTINIPMLGMMLLHPQVRERFAFKHEGDDALGGRMAERLSYKETARPTLTRTTRGRDLALTGRIWIEPSTGVVLKTEMVAADPVVRAMVTVTFRRDAELSLWVPERMDEYYKASLALDDTFATSTFSTPRVFSGSARR